MDPQEKLFRKQNNIYRLHELVDSLVTGAQKAGSRFVLTEATVRQLHSVAMTGLLANAGQYRTGEVTITNSNHRCPSWIEVETHMKAFCAYVGENWDRRDLIHLAAFVLWRLNWIHPFQNGNGRTARASCYLVMCAKNGVLFPPKNSVIEQIQKDKAPYYQLLPMVDAVYAQTGDINAALQPFEAYLTNLLMKQLQANF